MSDNLEQIKTEVENKNILRIGLPILYSIILLACFLVSIYLVVPYKFILSIFIIFILYTIFWFFYLFRKKNIENLLKTISLSTLFTTVTIICVTILAFIVFDKEFFECYKASKGYKPSKELCVGYTKFIDDYVPIFFSLSLFSVPSIFLSSLLLLFCKKSTEKVKISTMKFASHVLGICLLLGLIFAILKNNLPKF